MSYSKIVKNAPKVWEYNGAICFINIRTLQAKPIAEFEKIRKYVMSEENSVDVDNEIDLELIQILLKRNS